MSDELGDTDAIFRNLVARAHAVRRGVMAVSIKEYDALYLATTSPTFTEYVDEIMAENGWAGETFQIAVVIEDDL
jgi:hypothetical protein